jgi:hypothetical protein
MAVEYKGLKRVFPLGNLLEIKHGFTHNRVTAQVRQLNRDWLAGSPV